MTDLGDSLATDAEVWRYFEIEIRTKLKLYKEPLPETGPIRCPRTELTSRMESFLVWNGHEKNIFRQRVKQELPDLEVAFRRITDHYYTPSEIQKREKIMNQAETHEFQSMLKDNRKELCLTQGFTLVKTGLPVIKPLVNSQHQLFVPLHWEVKKRERFILYVKQNYANHAEVCKVRDEKASQRTKMQKFKRRLEKEEEDAEYQAFKQTHLSLLRNRYES